MKILRIISEYKRIKTVRRVTDAYGHIGEVQIPRPKSGYKRVEAIVEIDGLKYTRHIDVPK